MNKLNTIALALASGLCLNADAQCNVYRYHPVWPDVLGRATFNNACPESVDAVQWDDGSTDWTVNDLAPGEHWVDLYFNGDLVQTLPFTIDQLEWQLGSYSWISDDAILFGIELSLQWCPGSSLFNQIDCLDLGTCMLYLLQDGIAIDSIAPTGCVAYTHYWTGLPFGHTYQGYLVEHSACGSFGWSGMLTSYNCTGAQMDLWSTAATEGNNGSIEVYDVLLDPDTPNPPPTPLAGSLHLFAMPFNDPVGAAQPGTQASWNGLAPGTYQVRFLSDELCDPVVQEVTIELGTGHTEQFRPTSWAWPSPAYDVMHWTGTANTAGITDLHGRLLLQARNTDRMDVAALAPGIYLLQVEGRSAMRFVKD